MKLLNYVAAFVLLLSVVSAADLSDFPDEYVRPGLVEASVIVGDDAPAAHVLAQTRLVLFLVGEAGNQQQGIGQLSSDAPDFDEQNIISIGNACDNPVSAELLDNPSPCFDELDQEAATLIFVERDGNKHIVLNAYGNTGVNELVDVLLNYQDFDLEEESFEVFVEDEPEREFAQSVRTEAPAVEEVVEEETVEEIEEPAVESDPLPVAEEPAPELQAEPVVEEVISEDENMREVLPEEKNFVLRFFSWIASWFG